MSCVEAAAKSRTRLAGEEDREHGARGLDDVRDARLGQRLGGGGLQGAGDVGDPLVHLVGGEPQRGEAGRGGDRVPRQGAGLVDRALRGEVPHQVGAAAERGGGQATAHHLAEGHQVGAPALGRAVEAPLAELARPEAGHHLVADEQGSVGRAGLGEEGVEAGQRRDDAHVAGGGLGDEAGDPVAVLGERGRHGVPVVVGQHEGQGRGGRRDAGGAGQREGGQPRARRGQQRVDVAVVAAGELHHDVATRDAAGQPDRGHGGLGARGDEPDLVDGRASDDLLGELDLGLGRGAVGRAARHRGGDRLLDLGVGVPEQHRAPRADQVDVLVAVDVGQPRAAGRADEPGRAAHGVERPDRGVHAPGGHRAGPLEQGLGRGRAPVARGHRVIVSNRR